MAENKIPNSNKGRGRVAREIAKIIERHYDRFGKNSARVKVLIGSATMMTNADPKLRPHAEDLLRAATVFLHATVEELLRGLAQAHLPSSSESTLDEIPLAGSKDTLRAAKFQLGALAKHRGKSVDDLIAESVQAHITRRTFSNIPEIMALLDQLDFKNPNLGNDLIHKIGALIARRHEIVGL